MQWGIFCISFKMNCSLSDSISRHIKTLLTTAVFTQGLVPILTRPKGKGKQDWKRIAWRSVTSDSCCHEFPSLIELHVMYLLKKGLAQDYPYERIKLRIRETDRNRGRFTKIPPFLISSRSLVYHLSFFIMQSQYIQPLALVFL